MLRTLFLIVFGAAAVTAQIPNGSKVYLESNNGFDIYLTKAFAAKKVPLTVVGDKDKADFVISTNATSEQRDTILQGKQAVDEASMKVTKRATSEIVCTETLRKTNTFRGRQSVAEALANKLKKYISD